MNLVDCDACIAQYHGNDGVCEVHRIVECFRCGRPKYAWCWCPCYTDEERAAHDKLMYGHTETIA